MAIKQGWTGRVFEDFAVGDIYEHPLGRTILDADNVWFTCLTMNTNPIHFDGEYAAQTPFKKRLVNSCFTLALVTGQSVTDLTMNGVANLGWDEVTSAEPAVRRRHRLLSQRSARDARIQVAPQRRHRPRQDHRPESGRRAGDRVHADVHDLEARPRAACSPNALARAARIFRQARPSAARRARARCAAIRCRSGRPARGRSAPARASVSHTN